VRLFTLVALAIAITVSPAAAEIATRVKVTDGDTLGEIARRYDCSVAAVKKQNRLRSSKIQLGQTLKVPVCGRRAKISKAAHAHADIAVVTGQSVGKPWHGSLKRATQLRSGQGYFIRRPERAFGTKRLVAIIGAAIASVRADHPEAHTLAIGDLSAKRGGRITEHRSHQSGRDVDVGFIFKKRPPGYPDAFVVGTADNLDLPATWDLLVAFARTADDRGGVSAIFVDYDVQGLLYEWAQRRGVSDKYLDRLFQYPDRKTGTGLVRHEPHHDDHFHVRLQCPNGDSACQ
jgi:Penicillin-insensitive murein endopeptidase/LysM domain